LPVRLAAVVPTCAQVEAVILVDAIAG